MIVQIGDLHLDDSNSWSLPAGEKLVDWIINHPYNSPENVLVLSGDLTERNIVSGSVYALLNKLFSNLKYSDVYAVWGNHDIREKNNVLSTPYKSFSIKQIIKPANEVIQGVRCLFLPHLHPSTGYSVKDYEKSHKLEIKGEYDLIVGHFADSSQPMIFDNLVDISYIPTMYTSLGHIHNPSGNYIGSAMPNKVSEAQQARKIRTFEKTDKGIKMKEYSIPRFVDYYDVEYPLDLPDTTGCIHPIFTVYNCSDESLAREKYGDIFIRKCLYDASVDFTLFQAAQDIEEDVSTKQVLESWLTAVQADPDIQTLALSYL